MSLGDNLRAAGAQITWVNGGITVGMILTLVIAIAAWSIQRNVASFDQQFATLNTKMDKMNDRLGSIEISAAHADEKTRNLSGRIADLSENIASRSRGIDELRSQTIQMRAELNQIEHPPEIPDWPHSRGR